MLTVIFVKALIFYQDSNNDSTNPVFGIGTPVFIGVGSLVLGVVLMVVARPFYRDFFKRKLEVADPRVLDDDYVHPSLEGQI